MRTRLIALALGLAVLWAAGLGARAGAGPSDDVATEREFIYGVVPQRALSTADLAQIGDGGVDSFRAWIGWSAVEPEEGAREWSGYDSLVAAAAEQGVAPLPYLYGSPAWAARADGRPCFDAECIPYAPSSDDTRAAFAEFAADAVERYGPGGSFWAERPDLPYHPIRSWQIWNEQNLTDYWKPRPDPPDYARLLRAVAPGIRAADPGAEIILGGMWGPRRAPATVIKTKTYLRQLYGQPGVRDSFDSLGVHPYDSKVRGVVGQVRKMRFVARRHGDGDAAIWVTEFGWASGGPRREGLVKDRREQARLLARAFAEFRQRRESWDLRGAYWYAWRDTPRGEAICRWCPEAGLRSINGAPKPAWHRLTALAR